MSDWEDVFGPGNGDWEPPAYRRKRSISDKNRCFQSKKTEFNQMIVQLGFKWCFKHGVIAVPALAPKAVFLDRKDVVKSGRTHLSRLIIDPKKHEVVVTLMTKSEQLCATYLIRDKNAFKNAILIALDFKFSTSAQFINIESFSKDSIYTPL
ncbi:hypothetical protein AB4140_08920 [Shewanella sp. 10N.286.51.B2]|uniref:hypothetical protein n=1 Tax=Shewanella sp. 10N.286.51.B2 TaxID=3229707 RepID=UPI00354CFC8D